MAQQVARIAPGRVRRLVLVATAGNIREINGAAEFEQVVMSLEDPVPEAFAREFQVSTIHRPLPPEFVDRAVVESLKLPARVWRDLFLGFAEIDQADGVAELAVPSLLVWGDRDAFIPREVQDELLDLLPEARLEVYEGVGHAVHWERPRRFAADVAAFSRYSATLQLSR